MRAALLAVVLVAGLFVFGCLGSPPAANNTSKPTGPVQGNVTVPGDSMAQPEVPDDTAVPPADDEPAPQGDDGGSDIFAGKDWAGLMALGVPASCDVTSSGTTMKMYVVEQGKKVRVETSSDQCQTTVMIIKDGNLYMGCPDGDQMFPGCDWLVMDASGDSAPAGPGGQGSVDYANAPASDFKCSAWVPSSTSFDTPGEVCNLQDMYKQ